MREVIVASGVVIFSAPVAENDRRMIILSREHGRLTVFANGCRKVNSPLAAFTRPFTFAKFSLYPGRDSYHLQSAEMIESFDGVAADYDALTYGSYFLELAGYFSEENVEAPTEVDLLYLSIKALLKKSMPPRLVRAVYELKYLTLQGIAPNVFECVKCGKKIKEGYFLSARHGIGCKSCIADSEGLVFINETACYAMQFVWSADIRRLFSFTLTDTATDSFCEAMKHYYRQHVGKKFKSLEMILE